MALTSSLIKLTNELLHRIFILPSYSGHSLLNSMNRINYSQYTHITRYEYCPFTDITRTRELTQSCPSSVDHLPTSHELRQVIDQPTCHLHTTAAAMTTTPAAYKLMKMNPPPNECAAGSLCQGAGKTLGNHYCCRCKKTVHSVFCSKEVDSLEGNIKESFKDDEQKGSFKEVCNLQ